MDPTGGPPYAPPLPKIYPRGSVTKAASELAEGDFVDRDPYYGRVENAPEPSIEEETDRRGGFFIMLRQPGERDTLSVIVPHGNVQFTVIPDPGDEVFDRPHPYGPREARTT